MRGGEKHCQPIYATAVVGAAATTGAASAAGSADLQRAQSGLARFSTEMISALLHRVSNFAHTPPGLIPVDAIIWQWLLASRSWSAAECLLP